MNTNTGKPIVMSAIISRTTQPISFNPHAAALLHNYVTTLELKLSLFSPRTKRQLYRLLENFSLNTGSIANDARKV